MGRQSTPARVQCVKDQVREVPGSSTVHDPCLGILETGFQAVPDFATNVMRSTLVGARGVRASGRKGFGPCPDLLGKDPYVFRIGCEESEVAVVGVVLD